MFCYVPFFEGNAAAKVFIALTAILERSGVVIATRQKNQIIYALKVSASRQLLAFLTEACCGGYATTTELGVRLRGANGRVCSRL
jgi:hypothetical protein